MRLRGFRDLGAWGLRGLGIGGFTDLGVWGLKVQELGFKAWRLRGFKVYGTLSPKPETVRVYGEGFRVRGFRASQDWGFTSCLLQGLILKGKTGFLLLKARLEGLGPGGQ